MLLCQRTSAQTQKSQLGICKTDEEIRLPKKLCKFAEVQREVLTSLYILQVPYCKSLVILGSHYVEKQTWTWEGNGVEKLICIKRERGRP